MGQKKLLRSGDEIVGHLIDDEVPLGESEDAYKAIGSNIRIIGCTTKDLRCRAAAHCDDIQLIPSTSHKRFFGEIAENIEIIGGELDSNGSMQGIFSSDGAYRNLVIRDRVITTESEHKVSLCGVLDNCVIGNLKDKHGEPVRIFLDNLRFGGGAKGNFYVLSFKEHEYGEIVTDQAIEDKRGQGWRDNVEYLENFDLNLWHRISDNTPYYKNRKDAVELHLKACREEYDRIHNVNNIKIAIVAGHNATSCGVSRYGTSEFEFAKSLIPEILDKVSGIAGIEIKEFERKFHGKRTYSKEIRALHKEIDDWGANIDLELHFNAFPAESAKGHEVLYHTSSKGGKVIAGLMDQAFDSHLFNKDRNLKRVGAGERGGIGLKVGKSKSIICEPFFSKELLDFIPGGKYRKNLIDAYVTFFENVAKQPQTTIKKRTSQFTEKEYEQAMLLLSN